MLTLTRDSFKRRTKRFIKHWAYRAGVDMNVVPRERADFDATPFADFTAASGRSYKLLGGYRDYLKKRWRLSWWPLRALYSLPYYHQVKLEPSIDQALNDLRSKRTLPFSNGAMIEMVKEMHARVPHLFYPVAKTNEIEWSKKLYVLPVEKEVEEAFANYSDTIDNILDQLRLLGFTPKGKKSLEVGCGTGMCSLFLSSRGLSDCVGLDLDLTTTGDLLRSKLVQTLIRKRGKAEVALEQGDISRWEGPSSSFDFIFSISVLEHLQNIRECLKNIHRLLKPGGITFHNFGLWFGPIGGHSMNSYDFPWAHVRLSRKDIQRYLEKFRPHEMSDALNDYDHHYNEPRLTLAKLEEHVIEAGFEIMSWKELRHFPHGEFLTPDVIAECKANFPDVAIRDLLCYDATIILRKKPA